MHHSHSLFSSDTITLSIYLEQDEVLYEVNANSESWMIAGRKRGHVSLSTKQGNRINELLFCSS